MIKATHKMYSGSLILRAHPFSLMSTSIKQMTTIFMIHFHKLAVNFLTLTCSICSSYTLDSSQKNEWLCWELSLRLFPYNTTNTYPPRLSLNTFFPTHFNNTDRQFSSFFSLLSWQMISHKFIWKARISG